MTRHADSVQWTRQQETAIGHRGTDVFVAASAGTGKTAVLTGRCAQILCDRTACPSVLNILVVTFTEAAAEQMQTRIRRHLERLISAEPANRHLVNQLLLLPAADISTIHAFCKRLISEHFFELGLDGGFRVIDPDEQSLLKAEALDRTLVWAWDQNDLQQGLEALFARRSVDRFASKILDVSEFLDGLVDREAWTTQTLEQAAQADPFLTRAGLRQQESVIETLQRLSHQVRWLQQQWDGLGAKARFPGQALAELIGDCVDVARAGQWERLAQQIRSLGRPTRPKDDDTGLPALLRHTVFQAATELADLSGLAALNPDYVQTLRPAVQLQVRTFVTLVRRFDAIYGQLKAEINGLDFADLEHQALRLLSRRRDGEQGEDVPQRPGLDAGSGPGQEPSETAIALRSKYRHLFVDEYQDINPVQQAVLDGLRSSGNVFGVGDVKQSIYAFRGAEPAIFLDRLGSGSAAHPGGPASPGPGQGRQVLRVDLTVNFRSSQGILDFVNEVFGRIMTEPSAGLDYDQTARLTAPSGSPAGSGPAVELHVLDDIEAKDRPLAPEEADGALVSDRQRQAALIAQRIQRMVGAPGGEAQLQVRDPDTGLRRPVRYRDIVILLRSPAGRVEEYHRLLRRAGVPVIAPSAGFFEAMEVQDCLNLLKVLDNPHRDVEMAAVLRSPLFGLTDTDLARIKLRAGGRQETFYEAFCACGREGREKGLSDRLAGMRQRFESWRHQARVRPLAEVLWQVYGQAGLLSFVAALPDGRTRRANLLKLHERAIQFDRFSTSQGFVSLGRFVEFVDKLQGAGGQWGSGEPQGLDQDAVRILSIHKSKGLEFPVVILAELDAEFNRRDLKDDVLSDPQYQLGLQVVDPHRGVKVQSLEHQVIAGQIAKRDLAEEMRILYVAATRARERLILTGVLSQRRCRDAIMLGLSRMDRDMAATVVGQLGSPLQWVLYGCCEQPALQEAFGLARSGGGSERPLVTAAVYGPSEIEALSGYVRDLKAMAGQEPSSCPDQRLEPASGLLANLRLRLQWQYPHIQACSSPAKRTATGWVREAHALEGTPSGALWDRAVHAESARSPSRNRNDARLIGTATHLVLSTVPLERPVTQDKVRRTMEGLVQEGAIPQAIASRIEVEDIVAFFEGPLGQMTLDPGNSVYREWPFTVRVPAWQLAIPGPGPQQSGGGEDHVVVQGVADVVLITPAGAVVIDFKTDQRPQDQTGPYEVLYRRQLAIYAMAVETILGTRVISKWIYALADGRALPVA